MTLHLSPRQVEVCILSVSRDDTGRFYTGKAIGREMGISVKTVEFHMHLAASAIRAAYPDVGRFSSDRRTIHEWYWRCRHLAMHAPKQRMAA